MTAKQMSEPKPARVSSLEASRQTFNELVHENAQLRSQLADETERYDDLQQSVMDLSHPNCKQLLKDLAAERGNTDHLWKCQQSLERIVQQLRSQLAAERERSERLESIFNQLSPRHPSGGTIEAMIGEECQQSDQLREQLAAEERRANDSIEENVRLMNALAAERAKPKTTEYAQGWDDHVLAAKSTIAELVDALKEIKREPSLAWGMADAALAAVGEGKA